MHFTEEEQVWEDKKAAKATRPAASEPGCPPSSWQRLPMAAVFPEPRRKPRLSASFVTVQTWEWGTGGGGEKRSGRGLP